MTSTVERYTPPSNGTGVSQATAIEQSRAVAEVQAAVVVAQNVPRDINRAVAEMRDSCGRMAMAEQAFYAVPNRGTGASVHLARELARIWGNIEHGSHELRREDDAGVSEVQAFSWDKQTNTRTSRTFIAPHERMKGGSRQRLTDLSDIQNNNNNIAARAVRECIMNVLPRWFTEEAQTICRNTLEHGEGKPLLQRIDEMVAAFKNIGVTRRQLEAKIEKKLGQFDAGDVAQLGIVYTSITRDGIDRDEAFPPIEAETLEDAYTAPAGAKPIADKVKRASSKRKDAEPAAEPSPSADEAPEPALEPEPEPADEPPGALSESTPGQTERVTAALNAARKGGAQQAMAGMIDSALAKVGITNPQDVLAVAAEILGTDIGDGAQLDLKQLKQVHDTVFAWRDLGTLDGMVTDAINRADARKADSDPINEFSAEHTHNPGIDK